MEIRSQDQPRTQLRLDTSEAEGHETSLNYMIYAKLATFGDDIKDRIAITSGGMDAAGNLNMDLLGQTEQTLEYLAGRDAQPVVIAHTVLNPKTGQPLFVEATIGVLGSTRSLLTSSSNGYDAGFAIEDFPYALRVESMTDNLSRIAYAAQLDAHPNVLPFRALDVSFGQPRHPKETIQDVIAGDDIIPWIVERFGEGRNGYNVFLGLLKSLRETGTGAETWLEHQGFLELLERGRRFSRMARGAVSTLMEQTAFHEQAIVSATAEARQKLTDDADLLGEERAFLIPRHRTTSIAGGLSGDVRDEITLENRIAAIDAQLKATEPGKLKLPTLE